MSMFDGILDREVTRKEFLATLAVALVSLFGISSLLGILSGKSHQGSRPGYGQGDYGE